jgi:hypothetical protein
MPYTVIDSNDSRNVLVREKVSAGDSVKCHHDSNNVGWYVTYVFCSLSEVPIGILHNKIEISKIN